MAAFSDYLDLRTAVVELVGSDKVVDVFPRLTALAEVNINRKLRCREQISSVTLTFSSGSAPLPADFQEAIGLYDSSGYEYVQQPLQNVRVSSSTDTYYAIGASTITMTAGDASRTFQYYAKIPSLVDAEYVTDEGVIVTADGANVTIAFDDNWLLGKYPGVYLYSVAFEAAKWMKDVQAAETLGQMALAEINEANMQNYSERYSRARVRVAGMTP